jgi:hypothetical protein
LSKDFERLGRTLNGDVEVWEGVGKDRKKVWIHRFQPLMNEEGIFRLVSFLQDSVANRNTFYSAINSEQAGYICFTNGEAINDWVFLNFDVFGLDLNYYGYVCTMANNLIEFAVRRAVNAKTLEATSGTVTQQYNPNPEQPQQRSFLGFKLPF